MAESKVIKGQAWICDGKLLQEQVLVTTSGSTSNVVSLIDDIWEDLTKEGTYKYNSKKTFFYWEYTQTDLEGDEERTVMIECPRPKDGLFKEPYDPSKVVGEYAKTWVTKYKTAQDNYDNSSAVQPTKVILAGTEYVDPENGKLKKVEGSVVERESFDDFTNLLSILQ